MAGHAPAPAACSVKETIAMHDIQELGDDTIPSEKAAFLGMIEPLHRQLRPRIPEPYAGWMDLMLKEGARIAVLFESKEPRALAVWRTYHTTSQGLRFNVDDFVADERLRGQGHGGRLMSWLEERARGLGSDSFSLNSGVARGPTHRFYFRAGLTIYAFGFTKALSSRF
jgi:GNAT superfamily N-acetyltransferase